MTEENPQSKEKKNKITISDVINWAITGTLVIVVIYAYIHGHYTDVKIVEVCKDQIISNPANVTIQLANGTFIH